MNVDKEIQKIEAAIAELVYDKTTLRKAYNYYHGVRDVQQFEHLEHNYGLGTPTSIEFNPLVRPHIDRLVGEYIGLNQELTVTCKDQRTISNIMHEKHLQMEQEVYSLLKQQIQNIVVKTIFEDQENAIDPFIEKKIEEIKTRVENSFVSNYEIAAQNLLDYFKQSKQIDLSNKACALFTDLCIGGTAYYRTKPTRNQQNIQLEALNPIDTFIEKNPNSPYLADSRRAVIRKYMSVEDVIMEYREHLNDDHIKLLRDSITYSNNENATYIRATSKEHAAQWNKQHPNILGGLEIHPFWNNNDRFTSPNYSNLITVYEVEWIEVDDKKGIQTRHAGIKIGSDIYITLGESDYIVRTQDEPYKCRLSVNGLFLLDKNGSPNSIVVNTMALQDKYDLLCFYRDNLIANSGTVGDWIDLAYLPQALGVTLPERLQKWMAYKKQGLGIIDSSQEGAQSMNTIFNGFDDTVKAQAIQAINLAMQSIQQQVSMVTGILPEALAQYEQRDAVSNVQLGVKTSMLLTKQFFKAMDTLYKEINYDLLNLAKLVWKDGVTGTIVLGNYNKIFTALPEHYTISDFDIHIEDSTQCYQNMQALTAISGELVKAGVADLSDITDIITASSMSSLKTTINKSVAKKKEENNLIGQLQQQLQQYEQEIQAYNKERKDLESQIQQLQTAVQKNGVEKQRLELARLNLEREKLQITKDYNNKVLETKNKQLDIQLAETTDDSPWNNKVKQLI